MSLGPFDHEALSQIVVVGRYRVPVHQTAAMLFREFPHARCHATGMVEAMATAYLVGVVESLCICAVRECIDDDRYAVVGVMVALRHGAPIPPAAQLRVNGWVERVDERELGFAVQVADDVEAVADATIRLAIVERERIVHNIARKSSAIARRELYAGA